LIALLLFLVGWLAPSVGAASVLPVDQAFTFTVSYDAGGDVRVAWTSADGYYLYRDKFKFASKSNGLSIGEPVLPKGEHKQDEFFGDMEIYRGRFEIRLPLVRSGVPAALANLEIGFQGCADEGICYPPQRRLVALASPPDSSTSTPSASPQRPVLNRLADAFQALGMKAGAGELLPPDQAFRLLAEVRGPNAIRLAWQIADGYYLYREKFQGAMKCLMASRRTTRNSARSRSFIAKWASMCR
jgi:thiol:disulfide interchange protein DsbD